MENSKKNILVIGTGGTIACKHSDAGLVPVMTAEELVSHVPEVAEFCSIDAVQLCNIDSTDIRPVNWLEFACAVEKNYRKYDGFVICHGTDTLAYTGAALSYLIQNSEKPIVVTGAQKPIDAKDTDARNNLRDSIIYAADDKAAGVTMVFDGKVIAGTRAKKERSKSYNAFSSINFPNLAVVRDGRVIHYIPGKTSGGDARFYHHTSEKVFILKLTPGMSPDVFPELFNRYDCIIIESFGVGGIPNYLVEEVRRELDSRDTLLIMATQVAEEGSDMSIYQVGRSVKYDFDLLETYDMTLEAAYAKACWLFGEGEAGCLSRTELKKLFYEPVNYDLTVDVSGAGAVRNLMV